MRWRRRAARSCSACASTAARTCGSGAREVGGNLWRTTGDIRDRWASMERIGFAQDALAPYAAPGHWNDPDMLEIGNGGMTDTEYRTHMTLWSMLAAPLIAGNDLRDMSDDQAILMNREVIAIDQDKAGKQATRAWKGGDQEIWTRPLAGGDTAVAMFNRGKDAASMTVKWADVGFKKSPASSRPVASQGHCFERGQLYGRGSVARRCVAARAEMTGRCFCSRPWPARAVSMSPPSTATRVLRAADAYVKR